MCDFCVFLFIFLGRRPQVAPDPEPQFVALVPRCAVPEVLPGGPEHQSAGPGMICEDMGVWDKCDRCCPLKSPFDIQRLGKMKRRRPQCTFLNFYLMCEF